MKQRGRPPEGQYRIAGTVTMPIVLKAAPQKGLKRFDPCVPVIGLPHRNNVRVVR